MNEKTIPLQFYQSSKYNHYHVEDYGILLHQNRIKHMEKKANFEMRKYKILYIFVSLHQTEWLV